MVTAPFANPLKQEHGAEARRAREIQARALGTSDVPALLAALSLPSVDAELCLLAANSGSTQPPESGGSWEARKDAEACPEWPGMLVAPPRGGRNLSLQGWLFPGVLSRSRTRDHCFAVTMGRGATGGALSLQVLAGLLGTPSHSRPPPAPGRSPGGPEGVGASPEVGVGGPQTPRWPL